MDEDDIELLLHVEASFYDGVDLKLRTKPKTGRREYDSGGLSMDSRRVAVIAYHKRGTC